MSLRQALPELPMAAALSASHLAALLLPIGLRRLYVVRDNDTVGDHAVDVLSRRAVQVGIEARTLSPRLGDFNDDLRRLGRRALGDRVREQLPPGDVTQFGFIPDRG